MWRLYLFLAENIEFILVVLGTSFAYLLNLDPKSTVIPGFRWINRQLQKWRSFRERYKGAGRYVTLSLTVLSAISFTPVIVSYWPELLSWWARARNNHPTLANWLLFILAICLAGALFGLRSKAIKVYAFIEILVGVGLVAMTSFGGEPMMATGAKLAGAVYAIIRGLVNITEKETVTAQSEAAGT